MAAAFPGWAAGRNREAFDATVLDAGLIAAGVADAVETDQIVLKAPDIAENSALVHIEIESKLADTRSILLFAEKNPQPFVAQFDILPGMDPFVAVRIKMAESAFLRVVVLAGGKAYMIRRETKVTVGGCAG
jgi:sulfur-oxidizing protein SoxY